MIIYLTILGVSFVLFEWRWGRGFDLFIERVAGLQTVRVRVKTDVRVRSESDLLMHVCTGELQPAGGNILQKLITLRYFPSMIKSRRPPWMPSCTLFEDSPDSTGSHCLIWRKLRCN